MLSPEEERRIIDAINRLKATYKEHGGTSLEIQACAVDGQYESLMEVVYVFSEK